MPSIALIARVAPFWSGEMIISSSARESICHDTAAPPVAADHAAEAGQAVGSGTPSSAHNSARSAGVASGAHHSLAWPHLRELCERAAHRACNCGVTSVGAKVKSSGTVQASCIARSVPG
jgi:predicted lipid-binding transport protein (Tim44 family)